MSYLLTLTSIGEQLVTSSLSGGAAINITEIRLGSGDVAGYTVAQKRAMLDVLALADNIPTNNVIAKTEEGVHYIVADGLIPISKGGFTLTEIGLITGNGELFAIGAYPVTPIPAPTSSLLFEVELTAYVAVSSTEGLTITVNPSTVYATQQWVNQGFVSLSKTETIAGKKTFSDDVEIIKTDSNPQLIINKNSEKQSTARFREDGINHWAWRHDANNDLMLMRYTAGGAFVNYPIIIYQTTGLISIDSEVLIKKDIMLDRTDSEAINIIYRNSSTGNKRWSVEFSANENLSLQHFDNDGVLFSVPVKINPADGTMTLGTAVEHEKQPTHKGVNLISSGAIIDTSSTSDTIELARNGEITCYAVWANGGSNRIINLDGSLFETNDLNQ